LVAQVNTPERSAIALGYRDLARPASPTSRLVRLPTVDVVVTYYNEPVRGVRKMISRLRSELTWAQVNVMVYHAGIPGYREINKTEHRDVQVRAGNASNVEEAVADLVVPKMNVGRDFGTYLQHM
jgi:hypothetical protein